MRVTNGFFRGIPSPRVTSSSRRLFGCLARHFISFRHVPVLFRERLFNIQIRLLRAQPIRGNLLIESFLGAEGGAGKFPRRGNKWT